MKTLVYGYGSMGQRHAENALKLGHEVAVYDPDIDLILRTKPRSEKMFYLRSEDMGWRWEPDAVIIATPASTHLRLVCQTLATTEARLFVEKPLALTSDFGCNTAVDVNTRVLHVGYNLRFHRGVRYLKQKMHWLGQPVTARFVVSVDGKTWKGQDYADTLLECSHEIDLAQHLLGPADLIAATESRDCWQLLLAHKSGSTSCVHLDRLSKRYERHFQIVGTEASVTWRWHDPVSGRSQLEWAPDNERTSWMNTTADETYAFELRDFYNGSSEHACTLAQALSVLRLCDVARRHAVVNHVEECAKS